MAEVTIKGLKRLQKELDKFGITTAKVMQEALLLSGNKVQREAKLMINTASPSGKFYGNHRASAAGEPPKTDTGNLVRNIDVKASKGVVKVGIMTQKAKYGAYLEFGTSNMGARPWLKPSTDKSRDFISKSFKIALKRSIKKVF